MEVPHDERSAEVARIQEAYRERDASDAARPYRFANPGYAFYMQAVEWSLLETFRREGLDLERASVLDIGCGTGYMLHRLVEFGAIKATGVDLIDDRVRAARARYPDIHFVCANATALPFSGGEFQVVTQFTCLSSVLDEGVRAEIASEMWRVLAPGGRIVSFDILPTPPAIRGLQRLGEWRRRRNGSVDQVVTPTTGISPAELRRLFPGGLVEHSSVGLAFGLCAIASRSYMAAKLLASIPALREHGIGVVRNPRSG